jgi:hypothetical protein
MTRPWRGAGATNCWPWPGRRASSLCTRSSPGHIDGAGPGTGGAKPAGSGPVVLLDHSDNCASGGTMDTMTVLGAMLDAGLSDAAAFAIFDPQAVQQMDAAGVGRGDAVTGRQAGHAGHRPEGSAPHRDRPGAAHVRRCYRNLRPDGPRRDEQHGPDRRAGGAGHRDGGDLQPCGAARPGRLHRRGHCPGAQEVPDAQEPGALARRPAQPGPRGGGMRRHRWSATLVRLCAGRRLGPCTIGCGAKVHRSIRPPSSSRSQLCRPPRRCARRRFPARRWGRAGWSRRSSSGP